MFFHILSQSQDFPSDPHYTLPAVILNSYPYEGEVVRGVVVSQLPIFPSAIPMGEPENSCQCCKRNCLLSLKNCCLGSILHCRYNLNACLDKCTNIRCSCPSCEDCCDFMGKCFCIIILLSIVILAPTLICLHCDGII